MKITLENVQNLILNQVMSQFSLEQEMQHEALGGGCPREFALSTLSNYKYYEIVQLSVLSLLYRDIHFISNDPDVKKAVEHCRVMFLRNLGQLGALRRIQNLKRQGMSEMEVRELLDAQFELGSSGINQLLKKAIEIVY